MDVSRLSPKTLLAPNMPDAASYLARDRLRNGQELVVRACKPTDETDLRSALDRISARALYRRFFHVKRYFTRQQTAFLLNADFSNHVALVALVEETDRPSIVGGARYFVVQPGKAEMAFMVIDDYQGKGVGKALFRHLAGIARSSGLNALLAEVLDENAPMLQLFRTCGLPMTVTRSAGVAQVALELN